MEKIQHTKEAFITETLKHTIPGADASIALESTKVPEDVNLQGFSVGYSHKGKKVFEVPVGIDTSNVRPINGSLQGVKRDLEVLIPDLANAAREKTVTVNEQVETGFPRYVIADDLVHNGIRTQVPVSVARADTFITEENGEVNCRIIEINGKCPEAQGWTPGLMRRKTGERTLGPIGIVAREISKVEGRNMAVVVWDNDPVKGNEKEFIQEELVILQEDGHIDDFVVASPLDVEEEDGQVYVAGKPVDWIYRYHGPDDILFATSDEPSKNGVTRPDKHGETMALQDYDNYYGKNVVYDFGDYEVQAAGVMWKLLSEGVNGKAVVYPDAPSAKVGYKGLLTDAYDGGILQSNQAKQAAKRVLTPSFNLGEAKCIPDSTVVKLTNSSGGADVIVGANDLDGVIHALEAHTDISPNENATDKELWETLISELQQKPNGWIVQPQIMAGRYDLDPIISSSATEVPYDVDPWIVQVGDRGFSGLAVMRFKGINEGDDNKRINVVQGGKFTAIEM